MGPRPPSPFPWSSSSTDCSWCLSDCIMGSNRGQLKSEMKNKVFKGSVQWKNRMSKKQERKQTCKRKSKSNPHFFLNTWSQNVVGPAWECFNKFYTFVWQNAVLFMSFLSNNDYCELRIHPVVVWYCMILCDLSNVSLKIASVFGKGNGEEIQTDVCEFSSVM